MSGGEPGTNRRFSDEERDLLFGVLRNPRRIAVLRYLENAGSVSLGELAKHVAAELQDEEPDQVSDQQRKKAYISLYQAHLPKIANAGMIDFSKSEGRVEPAENELYDTALEYLEQASHFTASDDALPEDVIFDVLKSHRRRQILYYLEENGGEATTIELVEFIAAIENDVPVEELTSEQRKRVFKPFHQFHLPKMEETGLINHDRTTNEVELEELGEGIRDLLQKSEIE